MLIGCEVMRLGWDRLGGVRVSGIGETDVYGTRWMRRAVVIGRHVVIPFKVSTTPV